MSSTLVRLRLLCALLLGLGGCAALPQAATAFSKAIWGPVGDFSVYQQLGVSIYETDLNWAAAAPRRPQNPTDPNDPAYHWPSDVDQAVAQASRYHIRVMLQLIATPSWANGGRAWNRVPFHPADFAAFAQAAARRYPGVRLWMVWGEASRIPNFSPEYHADPNETQLTPRQRIAPHNYARLLDAAYGALKRASRANLVIGGATYETGDIDTQQWVENLKLPNGRAPRMDLYGHNPFGTDAPSFSAPPSPAGEVQFSDLPRLAGWIDRYLHRPLPLFLSEWDVPTCPDAELNFYVDPLTAARWVQDALRLSRGWHRVYALGWVHLYDEVSTTCGGLLTTAGIKKPTFLAFAQ